MHICWWGGAGEGSGLVAHFGLDRMCFGHYCGEGVGGGVMAGMCAHIRVQCAVAV